MKRIATTLILFSALAGIGCDAAPRQQYIEWVARDAWDQGCAEQAIVETFKAENRRWKVKGQVYVADVEARFKLVNECSSGLPLVGKTYKQFEAATFKKDGLEMSACQKDGQKGWALPGKESTRCWTGPTLLQGGGSK